MEEGFTEVVPTKLNFKYISINTSAVCTRSSTNENISVLTGTNAVLMTCKFWARSENFLFLTLSTKVKKCLCIRFVCLSVCTRSNSRKYSSNVLKLIYVIYVWHSKNRTENGIYTANGLSTETHKSFPIHYGLWGKKVQSVF